jgi:uncharacterized membrane protein YhaH (DUF805 family)
MEPISQDGKPPRKPYTVNQALLVVVTCSFSVIVGVFGVARFTQTHEAPQLFIGIFGVAVGVPGILLGVRAVHALANQMHIGPPNQL